MARKSTGGVVEKKTTRGTVYALRFRANGERQYLTLGGSWEGWSLTRAEERLADVMAEIRLGIWRPVEPVSAAPEPRPEPTFHEFASEWFASKRLELRPRTVEQYETHLRLHLLPFFAEHRLSEITRQEIDRYKTRKMLERQAGEGISNETINKTLTRLGQILDVALDYGYIDRSPMGKRVKLRTETPNRSYLDRVDHLEALFDAARAIDREKSRPDHVDRLPIVATLALAGLRLDEMLSLHTADVDLGAGVLRIGRAKTDAGVREVELLPALLEILAVHLGGRDRGLVFATVNGQKHSASNIRRRILTPVVERANEDLTERDIAPMQALTPHSLRRTFASLLFALDRPAPVVMEQLGHTDPKLTLRIYAKAMKRGPYEKRRLQVLAGLADDLGSMGTDPRSSARIAPNRPETDSVRDAFFAPFVAAEPTARAHS